MGDNLHTDWEAVGVKFSYVFFFTERAKIENGTKSKIWIVPIGLEVHLEDMF